MTRTFFFLSTLIALATLMSIPAMAQEKADSSKTEATVSEKKTEAKSEEKKPEKKVDLRKAPEKTVKAQSAVRGPSGATKKWIDAENALIDPLSKEGKETILILRNKHSMIKATRVVSRDVGAAVKSCGEKNPDMKKQMDDRYKQWKSAVDPILDAAEKQLKKDIDALEIVKPRDLRNVIKLHEEAYDAAEKQITKTPVTTEEACKGTLASMDRTEDNMIAILQQTLLPESVIRKRAADAEKAEAANKPAHTNE